MTNLKKEKEKAEKIIQVIKPLDETDQQRALDVVTAFSLGAQSKVKESNKQKQT